MIIVFNGMQAKAFSKCEKVARWAAKENCRSCQNLLCFLLDGHFCAEEPRLLYRKAIKSWQEEEFALFAA
jgi:hypothetical protein